ncbi:helix-turn-helix transcriptional regulator [Paraburkholderia gardini]|uniref:helix-turn-helix transcriptional regulator n=1 Tax=Paraburkholderia gardini TaxID=2823469 RepID=UPI001D3AFC90|nr:AraC family transcriptional regulator [Paraburkholderia gardini]CAG4897107.1 HTH-type transcriptional activator RhaR [Paraburkholderia gardini]
MNETSPADHGLLSFEATLAKSFFLRDVPTLRAGVATLAPPVIFSRLTNDRPQPGRSLAPKPEEAFIFQVPLIANPDPDIRYSGKPTARSADAGKPGWSCLLDLRDGPTRRLDKPFDNIRLYISQRTIDEFVYQKGRRRIHGLVQQGFGEWDAVLFHFSQTLVPILERPGEVNALLVDALAIAFCEHVVARYCASVASGPVQRPKLAPWQMQRIIDFFEANLNGNPSILDLASQCDLSASYFAEAFKQTAGISPHQWLLRRRIDRAKSQLRGTDASLAAIAADCGFFDQSHFSRVFVRLVGCRPKDWRLYNRAR